MCESLGSTSVILSQPDLIDLAELDKVVLQLPVLDSEVEVAHINSSLSLIYSLKFLQSQFVVRNSNFASLAFQIKVS